MADWWVSGKKGRLPPAEQAKLWGLTIMASDFDFKVSACDIGPLLKKVTGARKSMEISPKKSKINRKLPGQAFSYSIFDF